MKTLVIPSVAVAVLILSSCGPSPEEMKAAREQAISDSLANVAAMERSVVLDPAASVVNWNGVMLGVKDHKGTLRLTEGKMTIKGTEVLNGSFTADMSSITSNQDQFMAPEGSPQGTRQNLDGHLKSPEFFDVGTHPNATFVITSVSGNTAKGNFTIRGKTNEESVTDITVSEENGLIMVSGKLTFDRQKYGVAWSSGSKDKVLNDNIDLQIELVGKPAM
ncbi:MAG: YceI family protein [Flavobacteriales bacterium]|nr:YceI family protein [Flavobacteriales bacterium]